MILFPFEALGIKDVSLFYAQRRFFNSRILSKDSIDFSDKTRSIVTFLTLCLSRSILLALVSFSARIIRAYALSAAILAL